MKPRCKLLKWLLVGVLALLIMAMALPGCAPEGVVPSEEEAVGVPAEEEKAPPTSTPTPVAELTLDQSQTSIPGNTGLEGDWWLSQGFIPSKPILTSIEVYIGSVHANLSYPLTLQVRGDSNGLPSGSVLASTKVTITKKGWEWITFDIPDLQVNPGTTYHLVLASETNYHVGLDSTNPYSYGSMGYTTDAGATWKLLHDNQNYDMAFKIYGAGQLTTPAAGVAPPEEEKAPPTPTAPAEIGEEASDGQAAVTVHSVKFYDQITGGLGGTYKPSKEGYVFAIVDLSIGNVSGFTLEAGSSYVRLLDSEGNRCSRTILIIAGWPYELKNLTSKKELPPGEEMRGMVVFTAEEGTILDNVSYQVERPPIEFNLEELGKEKTDGQAAVTVHSVKFCDQITDGEGKTHEPLYERYVFALVDLSIKNVSGATLEVGPNYVYPLDNEGRRCSRAMLMIRGWPYEVKELDDEVLAPDEETRGIAIFSIEGEGNISGICYTTPRGTIQIDLEDLEVSIPPYRMPRVGETASGGGIEMRINSVDPIEKLESGYGEGVFKLILTETAKEGYELVVIDISIRNVSVEPNVLINSLNVLLIDTESTAYGKVILTLALAGDFIGGDLSPGEEAWGRLLFNVPAGVVLDRVMYKIGALGPPVQVSLR